MNISQVKVGAIIRPNEHNFARVYDGDLRQWRIYQTGMGRMLVESLETPNSRLIFNTTSDLDYYEVVPDDEIALRPGWFKGAPGYWSKYDGSEIYSLGDRTYAACTVVPKHNAYYVQYYGCDIHSTDSLVAAQKYAEHYLHLNKYDLAAMH